MECSFQSMWCRGYFRMYGSLLWYLERAQHIHVTGNIQTQTGNMQKKTGKVQTETGNRNMLTIFCMLDTNDPRSRHTLLSKSCGSRGRRCRPDNRGSGQPPPHTTRRPHPPGDWHTHVIRCYTHMLSDVIHTSYINTHMSSDVVHTCYTHLLH
jgi:hypothetical protein